MLPYRDSRLTKIALVLFFIIVIGYAYYEARGLLFGPSVDISTNQMSATDSPYILIQGQTARIASLSVDGQPIQVTETGAFQTPYVLAPGINRIVFDAKDKYGNAAEKSIEINYIPSTTTPSASESVPTTTPTSTVSEAGSSTPGIAPGL